MLCKSRGHVSGEIERVDDAVALARNVVMLVGILHRIGDEHFAADQGDVEWSIPAWQLWIDERVRRKRRWLERGGIYLDRACVEVRRVEERHAIAVLGDGKALVNGSIGIVDRDDPVRASL